MDPDIGISRKTFKEDKSDTKDRPKIVVGGSAPNAEHVKNENEDTQSSQSLETPDNEKVSQEEINQVIKAKQPESAPNKQTRKDRPPSKAAAFPRR